MAAVSRRSASPIGIPRAIERQPVEIIGDRNGVGGAGDAVETKKRAGGKIGCRDLADRLAGAIRNKDDIGRGGERAQIGNAAGERVRHPRGAQFPPPCRARIAQVLRQCAVERGRDRGDAVAIMRHHIGKASGKIDIAQKPDDAIEQQILHRRIEIELELAGNLIVEAVDFTVQGRHAIAVAHGGKGRGDRRPGRRRSDRRCARSATARRG